jgi:hypothetical protein
MAQILNPTAEEWTEHSAVYKYLAHDMGTNCLCISATQNRVTR